jgi:DNA-binding transcriptional MerR regulator
MANKTYTISDLAQEFGVTTRTIRFYEEKGLVKPLREGQKRLYSPADRVRIKLILRGKRIGMTLKESVELIDMYDPSRNNTQQLNSLINTVSARRATLCAAKEGHRRDVVGTG